ncbi:MAG: COX15/CtaA family protein [Planctomycetota bacterium]
MATPPRSLHILAWTTLLCALPLISIGGLVTSTGAGMAVPDWPNSFGYNMFALPWGQWLGEGSFESGVFQEHTHRLLGTVVGFAAIILCGLAWWRGTRTLAVLSTVMLVTIVVQGLMGGFRVTENSTLLSFIHGVFGQIVFALTAVMVVMTGRWWANARQRRGGTWLIRLGTAGVALVVLQLLLGAAMRHDTDRNYVTGAGAGLAIPDWPLHYGEVLPPLDEAAIAAVNVERAEMNLPPTNAKHVGIHFAHRIGAYVTAGVLIAFAVIAFRHGHKIGVIVGILVIAQVTLGILTVLYRKPADIATTHQAIGALLLATTVVAALRMWRVYAQEPSHAAAPAADPHPTPTSAPALP